MRTKGKRKDMQHGPRPTKNPPHVSTRSGSLPEEMEDGDEEAEAEEAPPEEEEEARQICLAAGVCWQLAICRLCSTDFWKSVPYRKESLTPIRGGVGWGGGGLKVNYQEKSWALTPIRGRWGHRLAHACSLYAGRLDVWPRPGIGLSLPRYAHQERGARGGLRPSALFSSSFKRCQRVFLLLLSFSFPLACAQN